jgi:hypothetical protein
VKDLVCCFFFCNGVIMHVVNVLTDTHKLSLSHTHTTCVEFLVVGEIELRNHLKLGCCYC